jgi:glucosamine-phosphate N-acetyltransferase
LGAATLLIERKFLRGCGTAGHIEDVVVDAAARGRRLGARLVAAAADTARRAGCYKVILDCSEANVAFYEKCGLSRKEVQMVQYF